MSETITIRICHRLTGKPIYTTEIPVDTPVKIRTKVALEKAASEKVILDRADLRYAYLRFADLNHIQLTNSDLSNAFLWGANLYRAELTNTSFEDADLKYANFSKAILSEANLTNTTMTRACLDNADLNGVNLNRANLTDVNLNRVNLEKVKNLWDTIGNLKHIKSLQLDTWSVTYTSTHMQIGCKLHPIEQWWEFTDEQIDSMDSNALEWWKKWKPALQQIIALSPAWPPMQSESGNEGRLP